MRHNMAKIERGIRLVGGLLLLLIGLVFFNGAGVFFGAVSSITLGGLALAVLGIVLFVTGVSGYCPVYALLHLNTCQACRLGETHKHMPV